MKPPFTNEQEMYNYAANQLMNQGLSQETVKNNLMERGVTEANAEIVIQNMLVAIEKQRNVGTAKQATPPPPPNQAYTASPYGSFTTMQEMYNYAANQLVVQNLSEQTVKYNLINKGVSNAQADTVIENMRAEIAKNKPAAGNPPAYTSANNVTSSTGSFASVQEMYNYAADQLIVKKQSQQTVKNNLMHYGLSSADADVVIKNMLAEIAKNKPTQANAKKSEGGKMMLVGFIIGMIGAVLYGTNFTIAGESFVVSYGLIAIGAILFFRGLIKMF